MSPTNFATLLNLEVQRPEWVAVAQQLNAAFIEAWTEALDKRDVWPPEDGALAP